jgi:SAM-dependent methyltransferase
MTGKKLEISEGDVEDGIVFGNVYDKYGSSNPIVTWMMNGFKSALDDLLDRAGEGSIHEVGCGEGRWSLELLNRGRTVRASDFSEIVIDIARRNAAAQDLNGNAFFQKSIYDVMPEADAADIVVCCEVLEHLEDPEAGLDALARITGHHLICSVPREPLWCALNMARGKYWRDLGNTPGHLQHWSKRDFISFVSRRFVVKEIRSPLPWTMLLCTPKSN